MSIYILKPYEKNNGTYVGPVMTFESSENTTTVMNYAIASSGTAENTNIPYLGFTTDQLSDADWGGGATGFGYRIWELSAIGSDTSPTISALNNHVAITEYLHSNHSNSINGTGDGTWSAWDSSAMTITISGADTLSMNSTAYGSGTFTPSTRQRTVGNDNGNMYYNGILYSSQTVGSVNEYYQDDTFGTSFQYTNPRTFTSGDYSTKVQGTFGGSTFVNQGRNIEIDSLTETDSQKITALLRAIDIQTYRNFKKEL